MKRHTKTQSDYKEMQIQKQLQRDTLQPQRHNSDHKGTHNNCQVTARRHKTARKRHKKTQSDYKEMQNIYKDTKHLQRVAKQLCSDYKATQSG